MLRKHALSIIAFFKLISCIPFNSHVRWNFEKFLVNHLGQPIRRYDESLDPMDLVGAPGPDHVSLHDTRLAPAHALINILRMYFRLQTLTCSWASVNLSSPKLPISYKPKLLLSLPRRPHDPPGFKPSVLGVIQYPAGTVLVHLGLLAYAMRLGGNKMRTEIKRTFYHKNYRRRTDYLRILLTRSIFLNCSMYEFLPYTFNRIVFAIETCQQRRLIKSPKLGDLATCLCIQKGGRCLNKNSEVFQS